MDSVLLTHPDVSQGVAFGVPDEKYGEEVSKTPPALASLLSRTHYTSEVRDIDYTDRLSCLIMERGL